MLGIRHWRERAVDLFQGDVTRFACDAIVNSTDSALGRRGNLANAIHQVGGSSVSAGCAAIGSCQPGSAVATTAGNLPASLVFHAVSPVWAGGKAGELEILGQAYCACLTLGAKHGTRHISFPALGTGSRGFPIRDAAHAAMVSVKSFLDHHPPGGMPARITFVLFTLDDYKCYQEALFAAFPE